MDNMTFLEKMKAAVEHVEEAQYIVSSGRLFFYLEKLISHSEGLMAFCLLSVGDRAVISSPVNCENRWKGHEKTLAVGQEGEVIGVDWINGDFEITFAPDNEWYMHNGRWVKSPGDHTFELSADVLSPLKEMSGV